MLATVFVILGILQFGKEAPNLLKEFFGSSGKFGLKDGLTRLKGTVGAAGALGLVTSKNIYDNVKNFKKNGWDGLEKSAWNVVKTAPRRFSQGVGSIWSGYKYGKESKNWEDLRNYAYSAAAEQMGKSSLKQSIEEKYKAEKRAFTNFYSANYEAFNSPAELKKAEALDKVNDSLKKLEDILDDKNPVKAVEYKFDSIKRMIEDGKEFSFTDAKGVTYNREYIEKNTDGLKKVYEALEAQKKVEKGVARGEAYAAYKNDLDVSAAAKKYKEEVSHNLSEINEGIRKTAEIKGEKPNLIKSVDELFNSNMDLLKSYKDTREAGDIAGKYAADIRQNAIEKQKIGKENK